MKAQPENNLILLNESLSLSGEGNWLSKYFFITCSVCRNIPEQKLLIAIYVPATVKPECIALCRLWFKKISALSRNLYKKTKQQQQQRNNQKKKEKKKKTMPDSVLHLIFLFDRLQEKEHLMLTPFERNLDFWRQLWRVIERRWECSDIIVIIGSMPSQCSFILSQINQNGHSCGQRYCIYSQDRRSKGIRQAKGAEYMPSKSGP